VSELRAAGLNTDGFAAQVLDRLDRVVVLSLDVVVGRVRNRARAC
jgi:hypothetical protein